MPTQSAKSKLPKSPQRSNKNAEGKFGLDDVLEAKLAATVTLARDNGSSLSKACSDVALACGVRSANQIKDARKRITRKDGKHREEICESYYETLRVARGSGYSKQEIIDLMLDSLRKNRKVR
jgi:hypothetical protein